MPDLQEAISTSVTSSENLWWLRAPLTQEIPLGGVSCAAGGVDCVKGVSEDPGVGAESKVGRRGIVAGEGTTFVLAKGEQ